jgi:hypothetical protein
MTDEREIRVTYRQRRDRPRERKKERKRKENGKKGRCQRKNMEIPFEKTAMSKHKEHESVCTSMME